MKSYLNLGCGSRYHPAWTNIDIAPRGTGVIQHDLSKGIPLDTGYCDVVYHSAALEHMRRAAAAGFLRECYRVLKPGGILRVAVPDMEKLCRLYLDKLEAAVNGDAAAAKDYEWLLLELWDQSVRERSGGGMMEYLKQNPLPNEKFVIERIGEEGRELIRLLRQPADAGGTPGVRRLAGRLLRGIQRATITLIAGSEGARAFEIGRFRLSGEVHHWAYDRYSLAQLLISVGFQNTVLQTATRSRIPDWTGYNLDTLPDGTIVKPDVLYMEALKPGESQ